MFVIHQIWRWIMGKPLSMDLRLRIVRYVEAGHSCRQAAIRFDVSPSFVVKLMRRYRATGSATPARQGRPPGSKLDVHAAFLCAIVDAEPDVTMPELSRRLEAAHGVAGDPADLSRLLIRHGFTYISKEDQKLIQWINFPTNRLSPRSAGAPGCGAKGMTGPSADSPECAPNRIGLSFWMRPRPRQR